MEPQIELKTTNNALLDKKMEVFSQNAKQILNKQEFFTANDKIKLEKIKKTRPESGTRLYDSIVSNCQSLGKVGVKIRILKQDKYWRLVYVLVCDGSDSLSKAKIETAQAALTKLTQQFMGANFEIKIFIVGIDLDNPTQNMMLFLAKSAGNQKIFTNISTNNILGTFDKILAEINQLQNGQDTIARNKIICFDIDPSASMLGKWQYVCQGVQKIQSNQTPNDYVKIVTFHQCYQLPPIPKVTPPPQKNIKQQGMNQKQLQQIIESSYQKQQKTRTLQAQQRQIMIARRKQRRVISGVTTFIIIVLFVIIWVVAFENGILIY